MPPLIIRPMTKSIKDNSMETIINKITIDLIAQDRATIILPRKININKLHYKIECSAAYNGINLFLDILEGKEKTIMLTLNEKGIHKSPFNFPYLVKTNNFKVDKITFNCFRKIELYFTLQKREIQ
jgi:hypothetical protein